MRFGKNQMAGSGVSRRAVLRAAVTAGAGVALGRVAAAAEGGDAGAVDYTSRETFDRFERAWNGGNANAGKNNENGALGWGEAYMLRAYVVMYEAHRDRHYLDRLIEHADQVLKNRDCSRGVKDYRGVSGGAWRSAGHYTCGAATFADAGGRAVLEVRTAVRPADRVKVSVLPGEGGFRITAAVGGGRVETYEGLTMDRRSPNYVVRRLAEEFEKRNVGKGKDATLLTAKDVRAEGEGGEPAGREGVACKVQAYVYAVQTGQVTLPLVEFVSLVRGDTGLAGDRRYAGKAEEYLEAVERAVAGHDEEWREDRESRRGWLVWPKGSPNAFDGCELPHNQYLSLGRAMILLSEVGEPGRREMYRDRAAKMGRTFKSDMDETGRGGYRWTYFWRKGWGYRGWKAGDGVSEYQPAMVAPSPGGYRAAEDTSHAAIDVDFAVMAWRHKLGVFDEGDVRRLAVTLTKQVAARPAGGGGGGYPRMAEFVDGSGRAGAGDNIAACWMSAAGVDREVFEAVRENFSGRRPAPGAPSLPLGIAYLNRAMRRAGHGIP